MLYLHLNDEIPSDWHPIQPCPGGRIEGGTCPPDCCGHHEWGMDAPNDVLLALPQFRTAEKWTGWNNLEHTCRGRMAPTSIRLFRDEASFKNADGDRVATFAIVIDEREYSYTTLVADAGVAAAYFDDLVAEREGDCTCRNRG